MQTRKEALSDIPEEMLKEIVQSFASDRAATVETHRQPDGRWTVIATFEAGAEAKRVKGAHKR